MVKIQYKCDKCGAEVGKKVQEIPDGWAEVFLSVNDATSKKYAFNWYERDPRNARILLCPDCCRKYGLVLGEVVAEEPKKESLADRLFSVIEDMVEEATDE